MTSDPDNNECARRKVTHWWFGFVTGGLMGPFIACAMFGDMGWRTVATAALFAMGCGFAAAKWDGSALEILFRLVDLISWRV